MALSRQPHPPMSAHQALRAVLLPGLLALTLALPTAQAQFSPLPPSGGSGGFTPIPGGSGGGLGSILGTGPSVVGGAGGAQQCTAPSAGATCDGSGPASQGNTSGVNTGVGNPINLTNGNKYQMEVDLPALPGELV